MATTLATASTGRLTSGRAALLLALLVLFARRNLALAHPMLEVRLLGQRSFSAGVLTALATSIAMAALFLLVSQWLQLVQGWTLSLPSRVVIHWPG